MRMPMKWSVVAQSMADRTGKQCRERYVNHLNPRLKTCDWSPQEDATVFHLYSTGGSHWAKMAKMIPGRTDNGKCNIVSLNNVHIRGENQLSITFCVDRHQEPIPQSETSVGT
jgi:hypothetical protein